MVCPYPLNLQKQPRAPGPIARRAGGNTERRGQAGRTPALAQAASICARGLPRLPAVLPLPFRSRVTVGLVAKPFACLRVKLSSNMNQGTGRYSSVSVRKREYFRGNAYLWERVDPLQFKRVGEADLAASHSCRFFFASCTSIFSASTLHQSFLSSSGRRPAASILAWSRHDTFR